MWCWDLWTPSMLTVLSPPPSGPGAPPGSGPEWSAGRQEDLVQPNAQLHQDRHRDAGQGDHLGCWAQHPITCSSVELSTTPPCWSFPTPNLTLWAITWTLTVKSQSDHYYLCFPHPARSNHPTLSFPSPPWMTTAGRTDEKGVKESQRYHFNQRNNGLPPVTRRAECKQKTRLHWFLSSYCWY